MITLEIHICDQRRSYRVVFEDGPDVEARALAFLEARSSTHAFMELKAMPIDVSYGVLLDYLYPTCPHGLSASLCSGPQHYGYDEEEQARGLVNVW